MRMNKKTVIGLFGYGSFGKLIAKHLSKHFPVLIYHPSAKPTEKLPPNCQATSMEAVASCTVLILGVNLNRLEALLKQIKPHLTPGALIIDVTSVKVLPVRLMQKHLPKTVQILATHPLFGPQSAPGDTLKGQKIIIHPVRVKNLATIKKFLSNDLQLDVISMTPSEHDKKMALVHGLTFFLARGLLKMDLPKFGLDAPSYKKLLALAELETHHSRELFNTIEVGNPYAAAVRKKFIAQLEKLHSQTLNIS